MQTERVAEVRNHDAAFALLIESFQQLQTAMIESDYQERIFAADQLSEESTRRRVLDWAKQERALRLAKLDHQVRQMATSYQWARHDHEREAGRGVTYDVDREITSERLNDLVVFVPENTPRREFVATKIVPSQLVANH